MGASKFDADYGGVRFNVAVPFDCDWSETFTIQEAGVTQNLTGETWTAAIYDAWGTTTAVQAMDMSGSTLASGLVTPAVTDAQLTALLTADAGLNARELVWKMFRTSGTTTERWAFGKFVILG